MKLCISKSKNSTTYYIGESYRNDKGLSTTRNICRLGSEQELIKLWNLGPNDDVKAKAREYVAKLNAKKKAEQPVKITHTFTVDTSYAKGNKRSFNVGYMFLRRLLLSLGFNRMVLDISQKYKLEYDFGEIFADLIYARILEPTSKRSSLEFCKIFYEKPNVEVHNICHALDVLNKESNVIQSITYKEISSILKLNTEILYYDCLNFYFESPKPNNFREEGGSKEKCSSVQMRLFMDGSGIPLAFTLSSNNRKETLPSPLEDKIFKDFKLNQKEILCPIVSDGSYAVSTNFDKDKKGAQEITNINHSRLEIEETFCNLKSEFKAHLVNLPLQEHIQAHFIVCFMALLVLKILEKLLNENLEKPFTAPQIISQLHKMCISKVDRFFCGGFERTELTDRLQELMQMKFDCEFLSQELMSKNLKKSKKIFAPSKPKS